MNRLSLGVLLFIIPVTMPNPGWASPLPNPINQKEYPARTIKPDHETWPVHDLRVTRPIEATREPLSLVSTLETRPTEGAREMMGASGANLLMEVEQVIRQKRAISGFTGVRVSSGINLQLSTGSSETVEIETDEKLLSEVTTEVHDGILEIGMKEHFWSWRSNRARIVAFVTAKRLESVEASSGSSVKGMTPILANHLEIKGSSGSSMTLEVQVDHLTGKSSSGSDVRLSGVAKELDLEASSGSSVKADALHSQNARVRSSSGSDIHLTVSGELDARSSSGSSVHYKGNPTKISKEKSSGASIDRD